MASATPFHAYGLTPDNNYYQYSACSNIGDIVRFYDESDSNSIHGNAVCSDDCILKHKNAILPSLLPHRDISVSPVCDIIGKNSSYDSGQSEICPISLLNSNVLVDEFSTCIVGGNTAQHRRVLYNEYSTYVKRKLISLIPDISSVQPTTSAQRDLAISDGRYDPSGGTPGSITGPLIDFNNDQAIQNVIHGYGPLFPDKNLIWNVGLTCLVNDLTIQRETLGNCRDAYETAYGTTIVGNDTPLTAQVSSRDRISSMAIGCLYALDINDLKSTACQSMDAVCSGPSGMKGGIWRTAVNMNSSGKPVGLLEQLCRNYSSQASSVHFNPFVDPDNIYTSSQLITAYDPATLEGDPGHSFPNSNFYPSAFGSYVYRSCSLQSFKADEQSTPDRTFINCCANDFSDLNGESLFTPLDSQPPFNNNDKKHLLVGYNYEGKTPQYRNCFTREGTTCPPEYRNIISPQCTSLIRDHCFGNPTMRTLNTSVEESWELNSAGTGECAKWIGRSLYGDRGRWTNFIDVVNSRGILPPFVGTNLTGDSLSIILQQIPTMFDIRRDVFPPVPPNNFAKNIEPIFFALYKSYNLALYDNGWLAGQCSSFSQEDVIGNNLLRMWCGCLLNPDIYSSIYPTISSECTPFCNSSDVIQVGTQCQGSLCIIDDITINIINSTAGTVSIEQYCNACATNTNTDTTTVSQKCNCILGANINITAIESKIGNITIDQICQTGKNGTTNPQDQINQTGANLLPWGGDIPVSVIAMIVIIVFLIISLRHNSSIRNGLLITLFLLFILFGIFYYYSIATTKTL